MARSCAVDSRSDDSDGTGSVEAADDSAPALSAVDSSKRDPSIASCRGFNDEVDAMN